MVPAAWWHPGGLLSVLTQWDGEGLLAVSVGLLAFWTILFATGQYVIYETQK